MTAPNNPDGTLRTAQVLTKRCLLTAFHCCFSLSSHCFSLLLFTVFSLPFSAALPLYFYCLFTVFLRSFCCPATAVYGPFAADGSGIIRHCLLTALLCCPAASHRPPAVGPPAHGLDGGVRPGVLLAALHPDPANRRRRDDVHHGAAAPMTWTATPTRWH